MSKAKKKKDSGNNGIEAYKHEKTTRKNAVPVGLASYDTAKPKPKKYEYDPHLDPQFVWAGKAERTSPCLMLAGTSFEAPTVALPDITQGLLFIPESKTDREKYALKRS